MTNTLNRKIEKEIEERFTKEGEYYTPLDPGRQEYRKCGVKEKCLKLSIEEVLFDLIPKTGSKEEINRYAIRTGYIHFLTYASIRSMGWVLIPYREGSEEESSIETRYIYRMYRPDKNFNRNKSEEIGFLVIVEPNDTYSPMLFERISSKRIIFAVSDGESFSLVEGEIFTSGSSLLSDYTPSRRE